MRAHNYLINVRDTALSTVCNNYCIVLESCCKGHASTKGANHNTCRAHVGAHVTFREPALAAKQYWKEDQTVVIDNRRL